jgi:hypothetical protein
MPRSRPDAALTFAYPSFNAEELKAAVQQMAKLKPARTALDRVAAQRLV